MKTIHNSKRIVAAMMTVVFVLTVVLDTPQAAFAKKKSNFKLSRTSISLTKAENITLTSDKKKEKIKVSVNDPTVVTCVQKKQSGKKTTFSLTPLASGSANITFKSGKKKAVLKVDVPLNLNMVKKNFTARLYYDNQTGTNYCVRLMLHNQTGTRIYFSKNMNIHGDLEWDGHYLTDNSGDIGSRAETEYAYIEGFEDRQLVYYDSPIYGLRMNDVYDIMTFRDKASVTVTVYLGVPSADNAYTMTIDTGGITSIEKQ